MIAASVRSLGEQRAEFKPNSMIEHWVGLFHASARFVLIIAAWYMFPGQWFVVIPAVIVALYAATIYVLARRPRGMEA